jgi:hypothetical protein
MGRYDEGVRRVRLHGLWAGFGGSVAVAFAIAGAGWLALGCLGLTPMTLKAFLLGWAAVTAVDYARFVWKWHAAADRMKAGLEESDKTPP